MKKVDSIIRGYSVEVNSNGSLFYGNNIVDSVGKSVEGAFEDDNQRLYVIFKEEEEKYTLRQGIIDKITINTNKGPMIYEMIIVGKNRMNIEKDSLFKTFNSSSIDLSKGLQQTNNSVFVASDEVLQYLIQTQTNNPEISLQKALQQNVMTKKLIKK